MNAKSFRAKSLSEALRLVEKEMGPDAAVLETREVWDGWLRGMLGKRRIEVTATTELSLESPFERQVEPEARTSHSGGRLVPELTPGGEVSGVALDDPSAFLTNRIQEPPCESPTTLGGPRQEDELDVLIRELCPREQRSTGRELPQSLFKVFTDLVDAEVQEDVARELVQELRGRATLAELEDVDQVKSRLRHMIQSWVNVKGPIKLSPNGRTVAALVGTDRCRQNDDHRKIGRQFSITGKETGWG